MALGEAGEALAYETAFLLQVYDSPECPLEQLGSITVSACENLRVLAILSLLVNADANGFYHNLMRSGRCRVSFLERSRQREEDSHHNCAGRVAPLLDVVAAGDWSCASRIVELSPSEWRQRREYEDDFYFAQFIHGLSVGSAGLVRESLDRYEHYLDGESDARFSVCESLGKVDQEAFDDAFDALLQARTDWIDSRIASSQTEEPKLLAQRDVYVDGLAILRLADRLGLRTEREYVYCPGLARGAMTVPFSE